MRKVILAILLGAIIFTGTAVADENFGIGAVLGEPTGITGKLYLTEHSAVDATLSWSFIKDKLSVHADYLQHFNQIFGADIDPIVGYAGLGGMIELKENPEIGVRIPLGISYTLSEVPLEFFFELAPIVLLAPETSGDLAGGLGARYYF